MAGTRQSNEQSAPAMIDEALALLRQDSARLLLIYYIGSLPFVAGLLFFWNDMSRNAFAPERCLLASGGLTLLFVWMKCWQAAFGLAIRHHLAGLPHPAWSPVKIVRLLVVQIPLQASGFMLLPLALLLTLPFGWAFAFYQNLVFESYEAEINLRLTVKRCLDLSRLWPRQNHLLLALFFLLGLLLFINLGALLFLGPVVLKTMLGIETLFSLSLASLLNTTFLTVVLALTYLCLDPLIKIVYIIRCFYGDSLRTGRDLSVRLQFCSVAVRALTVLLTTVLLGLVSGMMPVVAGPPVHLTNTAPAQIQMSNMDQPQINQIPILQNHSNRSWPALEQSIKKTLAQPEFAWRLPRQKKEKQNVSNDFLKDLWGWIKGPLKSILKILSHWIESSLDWLKGLFPEKDTEASQKEKFDWQEIPRIILFCLLLGLLVIMAWFSKKVVSRYLAGKNKKEPKIEPQLTPDLTADDISADSLPQEQWLDLSRQLFARGELRLALRAAYLATLAFLGENQLITIAPYKSNRDYQQELQRHGHQSSILRELFSRQILMFDQSWYGRYSLNDQDINTIWSDCQKITLNCGLTATASANR